MSNNVSNPLVEEKKPTTTTSVGADYVGFLQTIANNKKIENTPTNAKSYADYITYIGQDPIGDYNAKVRQANLDYAKGLATYGQAAEKMAKAGLGGSGYGEYLQGVAYQGRQSAVGAAQKEAQAALDKTFASYGDYLTGVRSTNEQNAITGIVNGLLEGDAAREYARGQGVTDDRIEAVLQQTSGSVSAAKAQKAQQQQAMLADAMSSVTTVMDAGHTMEEALAMMKGVYGDEVIEQVRGNLQTSNSVKAGSAIDTATGVTDFKSGLDVMEGTGDLAEGEYEAKLKAGSAKNMEFINALVNDGKLDGMTDYINTLAETKKDGTVKKTGAEVWAEMSNEEKSDQITEWVDALYEQGNLTEEDYNKFFFEQEYSSLTDDTDSPKEYVNWYENLGTQLSNGRITKEQYNILAQAYSDELVGDFGNVTDAKASYGSVGWTIAYKQGKYGDESFFIDPTDMTSCNGDGFILGREIGTGYPNARPGSKIGIAFGTINGKLAFRIATKTTGGTSYKYFTNVEDGYTNTKHNAAFMAWALTPADSQVFGPSLQ